MKRDEFLTEAMGECWHEFPPHGLKVKPNGRTYNFLRRLSSHIQTTKQKGGANAKSKF